MYTKEDSFIWKYGYITLLTKIYLAIHGYHLLIYLELYLIYRQLSNISHTLVGN